jgi:hypothetical protein
MDPFSLITFECVSSILKTHAISAPCKYSLKKIGQDLSIEETEAQRREGTPKGSSTKSGQDHRLLTLSMWKSFGLEKMSLKIKFTPLFLSGLPFFFPLS